MIDAPRGEALPDTNIDPLGDRPEPGQWTLGRGWPLVIWWKCPTCEGQVSIEPHEVDADGRVVDDMRHSQGNELGRPLCSWKSGLRLLDYDRAEHEAAVQRANQAEAERRTS